MTFPINTKLLNLIMAVVLLLLLPTAVFGITAEEIIKKLEDNKVHETVKSEGKMIIEDRFGKRTTSFISYGKGEDKSLIEFTSAAEKGQKILRLDDQIYLYYPDASQLIRIQGSSLKDSVMGSDLSYEDMTGGKGILDDYKAELVGEETVDGYECYHVRLTAKTARVAYYTQELWVDTELFANRKMQMFSRSGDLLKEILVKNIMEVDGNYVPKRMMVDDALKSNSSTEFILETMKIGANISEDMFSVEELTW